MNTQKEILSFSEYIKYIEENYSRNSLFRGLKDKSFALIPKIGRDNYLRKCFEDKVVSLDKLQDLEEQTMNENVRPSFGFTGNESVGPVDNRATLRFANEIFGLDGKPINCSLFCNRKCRDRRGNLCDRLNSV